MESVFRRRYRKNGKFHSDLVNKNYEERLRRMKLTTLKDRCKRGDLVEVYKVVNEQKEIE